MKKLILATLMIFVSAGESYAVVKCKQSDGKVIYSQTGAECEKIEKNVNVKPASGGFGFRDVDEAEDALRDTESRIELQRARERLDNARRNMPADNKLMWKKDREAKKAEVRQLESNVEQALNSARQSNTDEAIKEIEMLNRKRAQELNSVNSAKIQNKTGRESILKEKASLNE